MTTFAFALAAFAGTGLMIHIATSAVAVRRVRRGASAPMPRLADAPFISVIRPVCGDENHLLETLGSAFALDYPKYELLFCAAAPDDPAVATVRRLIAAHPQVRARLLIGGESISGNPKLNNIVKGWRASTAEWVVMADSNVLMPPDYLQRLLGAWRADTGVVSSPPVGARPEGAWSEIECAFLNTYQARWQCAADAFGKGFAQGKSLLFRRSLLERWGGLRQLATEPAEDAAATKAVRAAGLRVRLVDAPFAQPLGARSGAEVWKRQVRWARLRRASFPFYYALEIMTGGALPTCAVAVAATLADLPLGTAVLFVGAWYGCEALLASRTGWHVARWSPLAWIARDLMLPVVWIAGWAGSTFVWRGNAMRTAESGRAI